MYGLWPRLKCWPILWWVIFSLHSTSIFANPPATEPGETDASIIKKSVTWLVDTRHDVTENITDVAERMDKFFAGEGAEQLSNGTYMKLGTYQRFDKGGDMTLQQKFKLKLDLPQTENRLKLVFETDEQDTDSLEDRNRNVPIESVRLDDEDNLSGAFRFLLTERYKWKTSFDAGLRTPLPLEPFVRLRFRRKHQMDENWQMRINQAFYYYHQEGWGQRSQLYFERAITDSYFFRNKSEAQFSDEDNRFEFAEILSTYHVLDERNAIDYSVGVSGANRPSLQISSYFVRTTYRRILYSDWFYLSVTPDLFFPREESFSPVPSFTIGLDVIFSE